MASGSPWKPEKRVGATLFLYALQSNQRFLRQIYYRVRYHFSTRFHVTT